MKKQITRLFTVVAMAASPAAANPPAQPDPWAVSAAVSPFTADESSRAIGIMISMGFAALARPRPVPAVVPAPMVVARPRTTPSGAPACGNVATRAPRPRECASPTAPILAGDPAPAPTIAASPTARGAR